MKRKLIIITMVVGLMAATVVGATPNGQPFNQLWDAINDLQQQINDIQDLSGFNTYVVEETVLIDPDTAENITVECESGDIALSGGYRIDDEAILHHFEPAPYDTANPTGWRFVIVNPTTIQTNNALEVLCLDLTP